MYEDEEKHFMNPIQTNLALTDYPMIRLSNWLKWIKLQEITISGSYPSFKTVEKNNFLFDTLAC